MIVKIEEKDLGNISEIHKKYLPSILSLYPISFIERFYKYQLHQKEMVFLGFLENEKLQGFVFGTYHIERLFDDFIKENKGYFYLQTLKAILLHPKLLGFAFSNIFLSPPPLDCKKQLVYIAVNKQKKGLGIGQQLLDAFENSISKDTKYYELEVEKYNEALNFYKKNNFFVVKEIDNWTEKKYLLGKKIK